MATLRNFASYYLLAILASAASLAVAGEATIRCAPLTLPVAATGPPPGPYLEFCERNPGACSLTGDAVIPWTGDTRDRLSRINREVNDAVEFLPDPQNSGREDVWSYPEPENCYGDCEDFALEKRRRLVGEGVPSAALTMAIVFHETQLFPHAVLLAETEAGTWVLDNLHDELLCWDAVPYFYTRREQPDGSWARFVQP